MTWITTSWDKTPVGIHYSGLQQPRLRGADGHQHLTFHALGFAALPSNSAKAPPFVDEAFILTHGHKNGANQQRIMGHWQRPCFPIQAGETLMYNAPTNYVHLKDTSLHIKSNGITVDCKDSRFNGTLSDNKGSLDALRQHVDAIRQKLNTLDKNFSEHAHAGSGTPAVVPPVPPNESPSPIPISPDIPPLGNNA